MAEAGAAVPPLSPRARLVIALLLAFGIAALQGVRLLPAVLALAMLAVLLAPERGEILRRLRPPAVLALAFLLLLPVLSGSTPLVQAGPLVLTVEGLQAGLLVAGRLLAIVALVLTLLTPVAPVQLVAGLRGLGLPALMADLALLTLRYLDELGAELGRARLARQLRGGRARLRDLPDHGLLLATALIRAQVRADRLWAAMRLRGHGAGLAAPLPPLPGRDLAAIAAAAALALALVVTDRAL